MRHTVQFTLAAALIGLAAACGEGTAPASDQAQVLAAEADQLGAMVDTEFGVSGAAATAPPASIMMGSSLSADAVAATGDTAPTFLGASAGRARRPAAHLSS